MSRILWIPFETKTGNLLEYVNYSREEIDDDTKRADIEKNSRTAYRDGIVFLQNYVFTDALEFTGFSFGRSACRAQMKSGKGQIYPLYISEFEKLLLAGKMNGTKITGNWTFSKKGSNYGLTVAK